MSLSSPSPASNSPEASGGSVEPAPLSTTDIVRFVQRYGLPIALTAILAAAGAALVTITLVQPTFKASATLVVTPPTFSSRLKPPTMSVQGYRTLLESDAVVAKLMHRLRDENLLEPSEALRTGHELTSRIFVSRRAEQNVLAPMIEVIASYNQPGTASRIANAWTEVFLEHTQELMTKATTPTADFVESQYGEANSALEELEALEVQAAAELDGELNQVTAQWERKISNFRRSFEDRFAAFQQETRRLFAAKRREIETLGKPSTNGVDRTEGSPDDSSADYARSLVRRILVVREQLAQTPELLRLEKSISDDALWDTLTSRHDDESANPGAVLAHSLLSEEINPTYTGLALRATELEIELSGADGQGRVSLVRFLSELKELERSRWTLLNKLLEERRSELEVLMGRRQVEIDVVSRSNMFRLSQIQREVASRRGLVKELSKSLNEARLARAQENLPDIRLGAAAVSPSRAESKDLPLRASMAGLIAGLAALVVALFREVAAR